MPISRRRRANLLPQSPFCGFHPKSGGLEQGLGQLRLSLNVDVVTGYCDERTLRLKDKKSPMVLTVNGRAELVVQDAVGYQLILERLERAETVGAIRRGMKNAEEGRMMPLTDAAAKLKASNYRHRPEPVTRDPQRDRNATGNQPSH